MICGAASFKEGDDASKGIKIYGGEKIFKFRTISTIKGPFHKFADAMQKYFAEGHGKLILTKWNK